MNRIRRGTEIYIEIEIRDRTQSPSTLLSPDGGAFFTLKNPSGTTVLNLAPMTQKSTGIFMYRYQTSTSDPLGVWAMEFKAIHGSTTHLSLEMGAYELVSA